MSAEVATVLCPPVCERKRGTVHALLQTERGPVRLRFTPADAQAFGSDLRLKAVHPPGERVSDLSDPSAPILRPGGQIQ